MNPASGSERAATPSQLDSLLAAISEAIEALVQWDITAFQVATERQRVICEALASGDAELATPAKIEAARQVRKLNRTYGKLLQHSVHWTKTIHSILRSGGPDTARPSVHFRG